MKQTIPHHHGTTSPSSARTPIKILSAITVAGLSALYITNPGAGVLEFIPDNIPIIGNLDESGYLRRELENISNDLAFSQNVIVEPEEIEAVAKSITKSPPKQTPKPVTKSTPAPKPTTIATPIPAKKTSQGDKDSTFGRENVNTDRKNEKRYIAGSNTNKFHNTDCHHAKKIEPGTEIYFSSREEAIRRGYVPCKVCDP